MHVVSQCLYIVTVRAPAPCCTARHHNCTTVKLVSAVKNYVYINCIAILKIIILKTLIVHEMAVHKLESQVECVYIIYIHTSYNL